MTTHDGPRGGRAPYTVGDLAEHAAATVRALHHYDEIGLLTSSQRSEAGYRLYSDADVARLQQILFYRSLGFPLKEIARVMNDPGFDRLRALRHQRELLADGAREAADLLAAIDIAITAEETGMNLSREERLEVFDGFDPEEHREEAEQRWGETDAWKESARRTKAYSRADWLEIKAEMQAIGNDFIAALAAGEPADGDAAMSIAERARLQIDQRFYPCSHQMHVALGEGYVTDPRFTKTYEDMAQGLAAYVRDAIVANAERHR